ncbi:TPA: hypothetical protein ACH3X1_009964 [Trebouxia sp. C0004]
MAKNKERQSRQDGPFKRLRNRFSPSPFRQPESPSQLEPSATRAPILSTPGIDAAPSAHRATPLTTPAPGSSNVGTGRLQHDTASPKMLFKPAEVAPQACGIKQALTELEQQGITLPEQASLIKKLGQHALGTLQALYKDVVEMKESLRSPGGSAVGLVDVVISRAVDMHQNKQACLALAENVCYAYLLYGKESKLSDSAAAAEKLWNQFSSIVSEVALFLQTYADCNRLARFVEAKRYNHRFQELTDKVSDLLSRGTAMDAHTAAQIVSKWEDHAAALTAVLDKVPEGSKAAWQDEKIWQRAMQTLSPPDQFLANLVKGPHGIIGHPDMASMWGRVAAGHDKIDWETFKWGLTDKLEADVSSQLKSWFAEDESRLNRFKAHIEDGQDPSTVSVHEIKHVFRQERISIVLTVKKLSQLPPLEQRQIVGRNVEVKQVVESVIIESNRVTLLHGPVGLGKEAIICAAQEKTA